MGRGSLSRLVVQPRASGTVAAHDSTGTRERRGNPRVDAANEMHVFAHFLKQSGLARALRTEPARSDKSCRSLSAGSPVHCVGNSMLLKVFFTAEVHCPVRHALECRPDFPILA